MSYSLGLYIHLPYCSHQCVYCDFNVYTLKHKKELDLYIEVLLREVDFYAEKFHNRTVDTLYFGGGTPSLFSADHMGRLLSAIASKFRIADSPEMTIEVNPASALFAKLKDFRSLGINRLSLGAQTFHPLHLKTLERKHSVNQIVQSFESARKAHFDLINIDLIFGIPNQTLEDLKEDLSRLFTLSPEHISTYHLTVDKVNRLHRHLPSDELAAQMYTLIIETLTEGGYEHYEVSAFAKPGYFCRHHLKYWGLEDYLGIGAGAFSYFRDQEHPLGVAFKNVDSWGDYSSRISKEGHAEEEVEAVTFEKAKSDYLITHFRMLQGICPLDYERRFGESIMISYGYKIEALIENGLLDSKGGVLRLTSYGLLYLNQVLLKLI